MITIIEISQLVLILVVGFLVSYQIVWSILALKAEKKDNFKALRNRKFAVILLANNEQEIVSKSLYSLSGLVYPKNMYDLFVIVEKNSADFVGIARKLGATVLEVNEGGIQKAKNSFRYITNKVIDLDQSYEGLIIFDAKSFVSGDYLEVMNYYLEQGGKVIQSSSLFLPNPEKRGNRAACVDFLLNNYVKPLGKKNMGIGLIPWNNGTCYATDIINNVDTQAGILHRDIHPGLLLEFEDVKTTFAPEAKIFIEGSINNNTRDKSSNYLTTKKSIFRRWKDISKKQKVRFVDSFLEHITPSIANIITFVLVMGTLNLLLWSYGMVDALFIGLWSGIAFLSLVHIFTALVAAEANQKAITAISYWPSYLWAKVSTSLNFGFAQNPEEKLNPHEVEKSEDIVSGF